MADEDEPDIDDDDDDDDEDENEEADSEPVEPRLQDRRLAEETTSRIFSGFGLDDFSLDGPRSQSEYRSARTGFFLADVESDAQVFSQQLAMAMDEGEGFPCISGERGSPPVPIDVFDLFRGAAYLYPGRFPLPPSGPFRFRDMRFILQEFVGRRFKVLEVDPQRTVAFFRNGFANFLTSRFSARRPYLSKSPGIRFTVISRRPGERVHYSPAYFQKISTVFGSPTSPVKAWIQPGRYTFSVVGPNGQMRFDPGHYSVPPSKSATLIV